MPPPCNKRQANKPRWYSSSMDEVDVLSEELSDTLHRAVMVNGGRCWLLIDVAPRPLREDDPFDAAIFAREPRQVPSPVNDVDTRLMPLLLELDSTRSADSGLIREAIEEALAERLPESLAQGAGRRICGWLESPVAGEALARHIADRFSLSLPDGTTRKLRWFDPAVLWAMWPILTPAQRNALLGPIAAYWLLDPTGNWQTLRSDPSTELQSHLTLDTSQLAEIGRIAALNRTLRDWGAAYLKPDVLTAAREIAAAALRRGAALGFTDLSDQAAFALCALTTHPRFDSHPLVRERLAKREPDDYFSALVDDLPPDDWARIRTEANEISESPTT